MGHGYDRDELQPGTGWAGTGKTEKPRSGGWGGGSRRGPPDRVAIHGLNEVIPITSRSKPARKEQPDGWRDPDLVD